MATGTGKTRMAAAFIKRLFEANVITRVLFLVDRNTLAKQTEDAFAEHLPDYPCYVCERSALPGREANHHHDAAEHDQYLSGLFVRLLRSGDLGRVPPQHLWQVARGTEHFDGVQIGLTATPCVSRGCGRQSPDEEDESLRPRHDALLRSRQPTYSYKMRDAIREGYLVPYQIYKAKTVKTAAEGGFAVSRADLDWYGMDPADADGIRGALRGRGPITVDPTALERRFTIPERNRAMVREFRDVLTRATRPRAFSRKPLDGKTIVFAVTKRHAETLAQMFDRGVRGREALPGHSLCRLRGLRHRGRGTVRRRDPDQAVQEGEISRRSWCR